MSATRAAITISFLTVGAKVLGAVRNAVLTHHIPNTGVARELDIYFASFRLPDLLFSLLVAGTLSVSFIPIFVGYLQKDRGEAFKIASTIFNVVAAVMGTLAVLGVLLAPRLVPLIVPGFDAAATAETVRLTRILMLSPFLFALSSVATSVLQSHKRFVISAIAPAFYNLGIIVAAVLFYQRFGLPALAWGAAAGAAVHFLLQLPAAVALGLRPLRDFHPGHPGVRRIGRLFLPRIIGLDLAQISMLVSAVAGSFLTAGGVAAFFLAYDLEAVSIGVIAVSFAVAAFPNLAELGGKHDTVGFRNFFSKTAVQILFVIIPVSVLMLLLRAQIVRLVYGIGQETQFTFENTRLVANTLGFFSLSLFAQGLIPLLSRAFYALQNTVIPVVAGLAGAAVNIILAAVFVRVGSAETLALAFSIAVVVNMGILLMILHHKLGGLGDEFLLLRITKIMIASVTMGIAAYLTLYAVAPLVDMQTYVGILIQAAAASLVSLCAYLGAGLLIGLAETREILRYLRRRVGTLTGN